MKRLRGMGAGLALGTLAGTAVAQTLWRQPYWRPAIGNLVELGGLLLLATVTVLLVLSNQPDLLYVLALASGAGILLTLGAINTVIMVIVLRREAESENA